MENHPGDPTDNFEKKLKEIIDKMSLTNKSPEQQEKELFLSASETFNLRKFPDSMLNEVDDEYPESKTGNTRTVFEEVGIIRYLVPHDDPRSVVLFALYNVKGHVCTDIEYCAIKHFGGKGKIPNEYSVYYTGQDFDSKLNFLEETGSITENDAKYITKIVRKLQ